MKRNYFMVGFFIIALVSSCKSLPSFKGEGDLCGLIVDENNSPVKDFVIYCKNELDTRTALTDENGMFVVHGVPSGVYKISGQKKNYVKLENAEFLFTDRNKIFCCQVASVEGAFESVEELIIRGEQENASNLLDKLYYDRRTPQEAVVLTYRFFLTDKIREKKKYASSIKKIGRTENVDYSQYVELLEGLIDEK